MRTRVRAIAAAPGRIRAGALPLALAAAAAIACAPQADRDVRLARLTAQQKALEHTLEQLEARLAASQARVHFWQEIRDRHESVSAVACVSQDVHAGEMATHVLPPAPPQRRARLAAAERPRPTAVRGRAAVVPALARSSPSGAAAPSARRPFATPR